jgi:hypothetical protein
MSTDPTKENITKFNTEVEREVKISERQETKQYILELTEKGIKENFSDASLDRENEKIKLIRGTEISIAEIKKTIAEFAGPYSPVFTIETEYYFEIYRLLKWKVEDAKQYYKPPIIGKYTNEIIYHRFSNDILPALQYLNPYIKNTWSREYRHFQWLTEDAKKQVEIFIGEAVQIMKTCDTWYEFRVKYFVKYGVPFQIDAFENTDKIINKTISNPSF